MVILEVQNRPQEAPRENKKQHQKTSNNKRREEGQQERQKETRRGHADHWQVTFRGQRLPGEDNLSKKKEQFNNDCGSNTPLAKGLANSLQISDGNLISS